jgi:hypothetical protein
MTLSTPFQKFGDVFHGAPEPGTSPAAVHKGWRHGDPYSLTYLRGPITRSIPRDRAPYHPGPMDSALEYRDDRPVAILAPRFTTGVFDSQPAADGGAAGGS